MNPNAFADSVKKLIISVLQSKDPAVPSEMVYATFVASEEVDANLSEIAMPNGDTFHGVPKGEHVTGLIAGDTVLVATPRLGYAMIVARQVGNPTLYVAP